MQTFKHIDAKNIAYYFIGFAITTLGINMIIRSDLGAGPWDAVSYNLHELLDITLGMASVIVSIGVMTVIMALRRKIKYFIALVPAFSIALTLDFWDILIFGSYYPNDWLIQGVFYIIGIYFITFGLALIVTTGYPAMIFEELTLILMKFFKIKRFAIMRLLIELFAITLAFIFGVLAGIGFGVVNIGSLVIAFSIAPILDLQIRFISRLRNQPMPQGE